MTGTPSDLKKFYGSKTPFKRTTIATIPDLRKFYDSKQNAYRVGNMEYPVPYLYFTPTYFYQSLYETVPHIKPLLKNNDTFDFGNVLTSETEREQKAWKAYQRSPYNSYIWGLMSFIEEDESNLTRRNAILDHLLARQGESSLVLNAIISEPILTGALNKDRAIIKSLLLQNLHRLSYYRTKGYNYKGANPLQERKKKKEDPQKNVSETEFPGVTKKKQQNFL